MRMRGFRKHAYWILCKTAMSLLLMFDLGNFRLIEVDFVARGEF